MDADAYWTGYTTQPPCPAPCGCSTVIIVYGLYREDADGTKRSAQEEDGFPCAVNWCPRCEATWTGLEYRRWYYGAA